MSRTTEQLERAMESVRDEVLRIVREHEQEMHAGAPCWLERCNTLAFLGHCLGIGVDRLQQVGLLLFDNDVRCAQNGGCVSHPGRDST